MIHHIELYVSNLNASIQFWDWLLHELGYQLYQQWESGISWKYEGTYLVLLQTEQRYLDIPYHRCRVGLNHLAFHAKSREQVNHIAGMLQHKGINILYADRHPFAGGPDHYAVFCEDPNRIKVEIVAPAE